MITDVGDFGVKFQALSMNVPLMQFFILLLIAALHLPVIFFALQRRDEGHSSSAWLAALYSVLALSANVTQAAWQNLGDALLLHELQGYVSLTLAVILIIMFQAFLRREFWWLWVGLWTVWLIGLALIFTNALNLPDVLWTNGDMALYLARLGPAWTTLIWLLLAIALILTLANANRHSRQTLFRNRLNYWWAPVLFTLANDILLFSGIPLIGQPFRLLAAASAAYVVSTHYVPDLRNSLRRVFIYLSMILTFVSFYVAGYLIIQALFGRSANFNPLAAGAFLTLLLAVIFAPLSGLVSRTINKWMRGDQYDASQTLHRYSESISNILDIDRLSSIAVGIMLEAMQIERGFLFLVDAERQSDGKRIYKLRSARSPEERQTTAVELQENGILASYFTREQRPLLQYDMDLLPAFRAASPYERNWFDELRAEVYLPIFAKKQWIGLLAFGPKLSGNRYTSNDLAVLSAHANQTAVALENARLVDNLMRLNQEMRQARRALEKNNQELQRIDLAKSDFISIASHELRTPLTVIKGYTEMLLDDPKLDQNLKSMMKRIHEGTIRLYEVMDSMFDIAQINSQAIQLHLQTVEIGHLLKEVAIEDSEPIYEREQSLTINLPSMPHIKADPNLLKKLFQHIVRNAVKFTPNKGKITITGNYLPSIVNLPNGGVEVIISDTGVGVDPNLREVIFSKFYQPGELGKHSTSKTRFKGGGAGLGLALSKGIVEAHSGKIWVESPGYDEVNFPGSQFHIILPLSMLENGEQQKMSEAVKFEVARAEDM
jgi:signal transduction histidine kinase